MSDEKSLPEYCSIKSAEIIDKYTQYYIEFASIRGHKTKFEMSDFVQWYVDVKFQNKDTVPALGFTCRVLEQRKLVRIKKDMSNKSFLIYPKKSLFDFQIEPA